MKKILSLVMIAGLAVLFTGCGGSSKLEPEIPMKNGKIHGVKKTYHRNGKLRTEHPYINGKGEGLWKTYTFNGKLLQSNEFSNGKQNGKEKKYNYKTGYLEREVNRVNNLKEGVEYQYDRVGNIIRETPYINDKKHGTEKVHGKFQYVETNYINGDKKKKSQYTPDKKILLETHTYKDDRVEIEKVYDEKGRLLYTAKWKNGQKVWLKGTPRFNKALKKHNRKKKLEKIAREKKYQQYKKQKQSNNYREQLRCKADFNDYSMGELSHYEAIAKGKGEGSALGFMMKNGNQTAKSQTEAYNYCTRTASTSLLSCRFAKIYRNSCIRKLGF